MGLNKSRRAPLDDFETVCILRRWKAKIDRGELIACFPDSQGGGTRDRTAYSPNGGHGGYKVAAIQSRTVPVSRPYPKDVRALLRQLRNVYGYRLKIRLRGL